MTRINTNVASISAQSNLARSQAELLQSLSRLSTGLRINTGKDDPAGLIASEMLRSDIVGVTRGISNSQRANEMIATADSALGQVSSLLNDIRGLVSEAANSGAMSAEMIAANQLQIDSSLEAIDRIAQTTAFQGGPLLDGTLDFITRDLQRDQISELRIDQANLGTQEELEVTIDVVSIAERAKLNYPFGAIPDDAVLTIGGVDGYEAFTFDAGATIQEMAAAINLVSDATGVEAVLERAATKGHIHASSAGQNNDLVITAQEPGAEAGDVDVRFVRGHASGTTIDFDPSLSDDEPNVITVECKTQAYEPAKVTQLDDDNITDQNAKYYIDIQSDTPAAGTPIGRIEITWTGTPDVARNAPPTININYGVGAPAAPLWTAPDTLDLEFDNAADLDAVASAIELNLGGVYASANLAVDAVTGGTTVLNQGGGATFSDTGVQAADFALTSLDNNALDITAKLPGDLMNGTDVRIVERTSINAASRADTTVPAAGLVEYINDATQAQMTLGGFNDTANPYGGQLLLQATTGGTSYDDVVFEFVDGGNGAAIDVQYATDAGGQKRLQVTVDADASQLADVVTAINDHGVFSVTEVGGAVPAATVVSAADCTGGLLPVTASTGNTGGDEGTLYIYVDGTTTADDVVQAVNNTANPLYANNARVRKLFDISSSIDNDGSGVLMKNTHTDALTGGVGGGAVVATAEEVIGQLNAAERVKDLVGAEIAPGNTGLTAVSIFEEYATYGNINDHTGLQFLGPKGARNIRMVSEPGSELSVDFNTYPDQLAYAKAELSSYNANASMRIQAVNKGEEYNDAIVRFKASKTATIASNVVSYDARPSAAQAYLTFDTGAAAATANRNMILTAAEHGKWMNDVQILMQVDATLGAGNADASFDADQNELTIYIGDDTTTADTIIQAIEDDADGDGEPDTGFYAELDYSAKNDNDGSDSGFETWVQAQGANDTAEVANTGDTGGHEGGTIEVLINTDDATAAEARNVIAAINADDVVNKYFNAEALFTGYDDGDIDFLQDTNKMVTSGGIAQEGYMTIHLATGEDGLVTTTAKDLVDHFNNLTAEETRGVSVSLVQDEDNGNNGSGRLAATYPTSGGSTDPGHLAFKTEGVETVTAHAAGTTNAQNGITAQVTVQAVRKGAEYDDVVVQFDDTLADPTDEPTAQYDETTKILTVNIHPTQTKAIQVVNAINRDLEDYFSASMADPTVTGAGDEMVTKLDTCTLSGGTIEEGSPSGAPMVGNEDLADKGLTIQSVDYGTRAFVAVRALQGAFDVTNPEGQTVERDTGEDVDLRLNSTQMVGNGRTATMNTATLDLELTVSESVEAGQQLSFTISGGGARFQLGPEVVSNQQARLGVPSINTTQLGGENGKMFQLRTGGSADLNTSPTTAYRIVETAILEITSLRGRLGAFQRTTLETNINSLNDTLEALTSAESDIRDADFAQESAKLTRAQILVQSGISVLGIANQTPQSVLSLIRQ